MALIKCNECGHMVSDKAETCPNCGCPVEYEDNVISPQKGNKPLTVLIIMLLVIGIGISVWLYMNNDDEMFKLEESSICEENDENNNDNVEDEISSDVEVEITPSFIYAIHQYDVLRGFSEGMAAVCKNGRWGFINVKGEEVIPCQYTMPLSCFSDGVACVPSDEYPLIEFINKEGNVVLKGEWAWDPLFLGSVSREFGLTLPYFYKGKCPVYDRQQETELFINIKGEITEPPTDKIYSSDSYINLENVQYTLYENNGYYGYKDEDGKIIIPAIYSSLETFSNGVALATLKYGEIYDPYVESNCELQGIFILYGYVDQNGNNTFTANDFDSIERVKKNALEKEQRNL